MSLVDVKEASFHYLGIPYIWGGNNALQGFDCSGFVQCILDMAGADPRGDQTAQALFDYFSKNGSWNAHGLGALAFYGAATPKITHVGWCINKSQMIEAGGGDSTTKTKKDAAKRGAMVRIKLIKARSDLQAIIMPSYVKLGHFGGVQWT